MFQDYSTLDFLPSRSQNEVDQINKKFYEKFSYPWPPMALHKSTDQEFSVTMLNQDIGSWNHDRVPVKPKIWVAGCGTNQALLTALKFPESDVLGTDLSLQSLKICENLALQMGISNLTLEEKSINNVTYQDQFDYIICTGVIHHNGDPAFPLKKLSRALQPQGILELMVYNYYHMLFEASYQKAIRKLLNGNGESDLDTQLVITKKLITNFPVKNLMADHLSKFKLVHNDAELADMFLQPVLHSYTIETFTRLITSCDLEYLHPCINQFDKAQGRLTWNMQFNDTEINNQFESLPDIQRWEVSNLLMMERSPMFWFYLQRKDSIHKRKTEKEICLEFLNTEFEKCSSYLKEYLVDNKGQYHLNPELISTPVPLSPKDKLSRMIFNAVIPGITIKDIFQQLNIETSFYNINRARINLTTSAFPYLKAVSTQNSKNKKTNSRKVCFAKNKKQDPGGFDFQ